MSLSYAHTLFVGISLLYATASALFVSLLARGRTGMRRLALGALWGALILQGAFLAADACPVLETGTGRIQQALVLLSMLVALGYLLTGLRYRIAPLGTFVAPVSLVLFLASGLHEDASHAPQVNSILLPVHIGLSTLGVAAFALAATLAAGYLLQEQRLRQRRWDGLLKRLPALDTLDRVSFRLTMVGFALLTAGILLGASWLLQRQNFFGSLTISQAFALVAWCVFGALITLRVAAGWTGRLAAIGTLIGFAFALAVLIGYALGHSNGGAL